MGISISTIHEPSLLLIRATGELTDHDVGGYYDQLKAVVTDQKFLKALVDLSSPDLNMRGISFSSVMTMANRFKTEPLAAEGSQMAIVVKSTLIYGLARVFMGFRQNKDIIILPFKSMEEAIDWLQLPGISPEALQQIQEA